MLSSIFRGSFQYYNEREGGATPSLFAGSIASLILDSRATLLLGAYVHALARKLA
jgi:hypothetical protein